MSFRIYITDGIETAELDTENIDTKSIFALLDISDIGQKRNNISSISLKGTNRNNQAFGYFFNLNKTTNLEIDNRIFFNYNPIREVDIFIFENNELIFNGDLRIEKIDIDVDGNVIYDCIVTSILTKLRKAFADKTLGDLDLSKWRHKYCYDVIQNTYADKIIQYESGTTSGYTYVNSPTAYANREGYIYPLIDYGYSVTGDSATYTGVTESGETIANKYLFDIRNMKPAYWLVYILKECFKQMYGTYDFEIRASDEFMDNFNNIIIPDINEEGYELVVGCPIKITPSATSINRSVRYMDHRNVLTRQCENVVCNTYTPKYCRQGSTPTGFGKPRERKTALIYIPTEKLLFTSGCTYDFTGFFSYSDPEGGNYYSVTVNKNIQTSLRLTTNIITNQLTPGGGGPADVITPNTTTIWSIQLIKENASGENIIASQEYIINYGSFIIKDIDLVTDKIQFNKGDKIRLRMTYSNDLVKQTFTVTNPVTCTGGYNFIITDITHFWQASGTTITMPASPSDAFGYETIPTANCNDSLLITPKIARNIKIVDFIKSVFQLFNFVVYNEKFDKNKIIIQPYDEFTQYSRIPFLLTNSLDWTRKIDYTNGVSIKSNIEIPKSYLFTFKSDTDYLNDDYYKRTKEIYGQFQFDDELGITDQKKIELIFSPTPIASIDSFYFPLLYKVENGVKTLMKVNPRLLYYNGYDEFNNGEGNKYLAIQSASTSSPVVVEKFIKYPNCSNYRMTLDGVLNPATDFKVPSDIHFGRPQFLYLQDTNGDFTNAPTSYENYYRTQITDLTHQDVIYIECNALLNPLDIANLDLSIPIYIDTAKNGGAYFRVLEVEYENKNLPSKLKLQKIIV